MVVSGVVGVLARPLVRMVSAYGKILEGGGTPYLGSLCMTLEMVQKVLFWLDCWCGSSSLADRYPELYRISCSKEASVADLMRFSNGVLHWEIQFCREVHNREMEVFRSFIHSI